MKTFGVLTLGVLALGNAACLHAQSGAAWPAKPVRIVVAQAAGGQVDLLTRSVATPLGARLGQQIVVESRASASGLVGAQLVARAAPDGYTLLPVANTFAIVPTLVPNAGYDPLKDFAPISNFAKVPQVLVVNPALPAQSVKELIALARTRSGKISYASAGNGGTGHLAAEMFGRSVGIQMLHVPYKGNSQALVDVMGGVVDAMFDQIGTSLSFVRSGKLKGLAITSRTRSPLLPQLPTIEESGVPGFEDITFIGLAAPAGTPREVLLKLNAEITRVLAVPALRDHWLELGVELAASESPEEFAAQIKAEIDKKGALIRQAGIRID